MWKEAKSESSELEPKETRRIMKNIVLISLAFMVQYTAHNSAVDLQSSINAKAGLGTASLAAVYAGLIFSNTFLSVAVIKWIGTKWAISLSFVTYMPYIAANLCPNFYTMIPAGLIVGLGAGPLWCSQSTYLAVVSEAHSRISNISAEALLVRFFGFFFTVYQMSHVWGSLISSLVLLSGENTAAVSSVNASNIPELCGASFLPSSDARKALRQQPQPKIEMLVGIYLTCMAGAAVIVAVGVDSMKRYEASRSECGVRLSGIALIAVTLKLLVDPKLLMLVIISIFNGMRQSYFGADFNAAFVSCAIGTGTVGFVMMTFGLCNAISCVVTGYVVKITGRVPLICFALVLQQALLITLLVWRPQVHLTWPLYFIAALWGLCDSIWLVQIDAYYGILFPGIEEAAFANSKLWLAVGHVIAYVISPHLRTSVKTYLLMALMIVGVTGYFIVEYKERVKKLEINNNEVCAAKGRINFNSQNME